jgi:protein phosphatase 1 regulatory subunit 36
MAQEQTDHPILVIPQKFKDFIHSKLFKELLKRIYEYMLLLEQYEHKFKTVLLDHGIKPDHLMLTETAALEQKCKEISFVYMGILLSYGESKNIFRDQYFFETMIYFLGQILKENFEEEVYPTIDLELNRMFRTNTFNLIKRRYEEDAVIKEYPELKDNKYVCSPQGDQRVIKRLRVHKKFRYAAEISPRTAVSLPKPMNIPQSALKAIHSRSPLVASFYPSEREKVFNFVREH